jgi:predicted PurR-regulated permease PerM
VFKDKPNYAKYLQIAAIVAVSIFFAFRLKQTLQLLLVSLFLAGAIAPIVNQMSQLQISYRQWHLSLGKVGSVVLLYLCFFTLIVLAITPAPQIIVELGQFLIKLPNLVEQIQLPSGGVLNVSQEQLNRLLQTQPLIEQVQNFGKDLVGQTFSFTVQVFSGIGFGVLSMLLAAYMVIKSEQLLRRVLSPFESQVQQQIKMLIPPITKCLGAYVVGRFGTSSLLGFCTYLVLSLFGIPFAGALGLVTAITNLIPYVGGLTALIAIFIAAWSVSFNQGAIAIFLCFSLQQIEAFILQPWLVAPYLNLDAFELLLSIIVGAELFGVVGAILAPPLTGIGRILFNHFWHGADFPQS